MSSENHLLPRPPHAESFEPENKPGSLSQLVAHQSPGPQDSLAQGRSQGVVHPNPPFRIGHNTDHAQGKVRTIRSSSQRMSASKNHRRAKWTNIWLSKVRCIY